MATTQSLGIVIKATNRSAAAFAQTNRQLGALERRMRGLNRGLGAFVGGNAIARLVSGIIKVNKAESEELLNTFGRLRTAFHDFALAVGGAGLNEALINMARTIGGLVVGTNGLAQALGSFLSAAVNTLTAAFVALARGIMFVRDNWDLLLRLTIAWVGINIAQMVVRGAIAFVQLAKAVRLAGLATAFMNAIQRNSVIVFLLLGAAIAKVLGKLDQFTQFFKTLGSEISKALPKLGTLAAEGLNSLGFNIDSLNMDLETMNMKFDSLAPTLDAVNPKFRETGRSLKAAKDQAKEFMDSLKGVFDNLGGSIVDGIVAVRDGTNSIKGVIRDMVDNILQDLARLFLNKLFQQLISGLFFGGQFGFGSLFGANNPGVGPGGLGFTTFGGPRAGGGGVSPGRIYRVGEKGPELFAPGVSGSILPGGSGKGSGVTIIDQRGANAPAVQQQGRDRNGNPILVIRDVARKEFSKMIKPTMTNQFGIAPTMAQRG